MNCKFCYHHHEGDLTKGKFHDHDAIVQEIGKGLSRGNTWCDFTGGEPTMHPDICQFIELLNKKNCGSTIITNGVVNQFVIDNLIESGLKEFLVSIHGLEETHNKLTIQGARKSQIKFLEQINGRVGLRFNCVINQFNQNELIETSEWMRQWNPSIVNFINMNPHHGWMHDNQAIEDIIAGFYIVRPQLDASIKLLEDAGIGVNVRYYPMCQIAEEYRRCICNDLHVVFDPYEWDYGIRVKQPEVFLQWGINGSNNIECKEYPCKECDLQWICGGLNSKFLEIAGEKCIIPQRISFEKYEDQFNFYYYRQHNDRTLVMKEAAQ